ncbi:muconolactone Delta-isomerase family protein [uncultured Sunxiuqinia sp.]|uniref:muconolactone Delta-isomerase family protein n=1 Tax=uncultured Sunxiuqinia sp. TaxID=1573825 RepID=UPI0030DA9E27|tara:strand:- start:11514 stop:11801 length:288 start_codon:yes stop_codon:yes gene_type:complete
MKIIAIEKEKPTATAEAFARFSKDEAQKAWELQQAGFIREIYFRADENSAVLVLEASSVDSAHEQLQHLPLVKNGLIEFDLIPLKAYPGFARLFK